MKQPAFSLVEMLMALLVASLLMVALAPVMTKRFGENVNVSGTGGSGVRSDYSRVFDKDTEWTVPSGVNTINITAVGGGGAGGGASYGYKEITSNESNWTVPDNVTKIRVFMTGAGGGGASGGYKSTYATGDLNSGNGSETFANTVYIGQTTWTVPNDAKAPILDSKCLASGETQWILASDNTTRVAPGVDSVLNITACGAGGAGGGSTWPNSFYGGGGGSGDYIKDYKLVVSQNNLYIRIPGQSGGGGGSSGMDEIPGNNGNDAGFSSGGGGGACHSNTYGGGTQQIGSMIMGGIGGGGSQAGAPSHGAPGFGDWLAYGGGGGADTVRQVEGDAWAGAGGRGTYFGAGGGGGGKGHGACGGGGGGGGPTLILKENSNSISSILFTASGGGGGGGSGERNGGGGGGGGGGTSGGGGGGGAGNNIFGTAGAGNPNGKWGTQAPHAWLGGAGGGGGTNGVSGSTTSNAGGKLTTNIFGSNFCNGGDGVVGTGGNGSNGKPGAMKIEWLKTANSLKCQYKDKTNSGGGGGSGQVWIGEISVTPGQKLNFNIGMGGNGGNSNNTNNSSNNHDGKNGGDTSIYAGSTKLVLVSGGKGGRYETNNTYIANSGGYGGGIITSDADGIASGNLTNYSKTNNWTSIDIDTLKSMAGLGGSQGNTIANGAGGGAGGNTIKRDGTISLGATSVNAQTNGNDAIAANYGSGGSGGGGVINYGGKHGIGGKGANGYIYIEWGNANGGGGSTGQVLKRNKVWVSAGTKIQIKVGKGGEPKPMLTTLNGVSGYFGQQGNNGGDSYVITNEGEAIRAKGGIGGYPAGTSHGLGGNSEESVSSSLADKVITNMIKGENGNDDYGGIGGSITEVLCPLITELNGLGGCGGNMPSGHCANVSSTPIGKNAAKTGGGGGGGAVRMDSTGGAAYTGGKGADGMVVIEWNN